MIPRSEVKQPNRELELWIDNKFVQSFLTFRELIEFLAQYYPKCA